MSARNESTDLVNAAICTLISICYDKELSCERPVASSKTKISQLFGEGQGCGTGMEVGRLPAIPLPPLSNLACCVVRKEYLCSLYIYIVTVAGCRLQHHKCIHPQPWVAVQIERPSPSPFQEHLLSVMNRH